MGNCKCISTPPIETRIPTDTESTTPWKDTSTKPSIAMTAITPDHADYTLATSIQSGLQGSFSSVNPSPLSLNQDIHTKSRSKTIDEQCTESFDHKLNSDSTQNIFTEYAPQIFATLREAFNMTNDAYLSILTGDNNALLSFLSNSKGGQYFFFSGNSQFIIKTMSKSELDFLLSILYSYYQYMVSEPNSLIARFYGVYKLNKIKIKKSNQDLFFLISNNVFYSPLNIKIVQQYDLKGSTQGRETDDTRKKSGAILKDLNFIKDDVRIHISRDNKDILFHEQIKKDCEWFAKHLIMDYSLLVGIADVSEDDANEIKRDNDVYKYGNIFCSDYGGLLSDNKKQMYFIGIIDILQKYNKKKKVARFVKGMKYEQSTLSTVPPDIYSKRFCDFFKDIV